MTLIAERTDTVQTALNKGLQLFQAGQLKEAVEHVIIKLYEITKTLPQESIDTTIREECLQHPIADILLQEPMTKWSNIKPRGYSGDAELIDYMYRLKTCNLSDSYESRELFGHMLQSGSTAAVRWRSNHVAQEIEKQYEKLGHPINVISVASGHLRELGYIQDAASKINRFICIDQDTQSNDMVRTTYDNFNFLEIIDDSISYVLKRKLETSTFDFIYSSGLFDYLNDKLASKMIEILYTNLRPGGVLIIPNFLKGNIEKGYMETFMKWNLIYRNEQDMQNLCNHLDINENQKELYYDAMKKVVYLKITKPHTC